MDRRFGEDREDLTAEERALMRFKRERKARNKAAYNVIEPEKDRANFFVQLAKCAKEGVVGASDDDDDE